MSQSFVNQFIHVLWSTKDQQLTFEPTLKQELYHYLASLLKYDQVRTLVIGGAIDHIHLLLKLPPTIPLSKLMGKIKSYSSKWLKNIKKTHPHFSWNEGYGAFTVHPEKLNAVKCYIQNDHLQHESLKYTEELLNFVQQQEISYEEQYFSTSTHAKLLIHFIWSTKNRYKHLEKSLRKDLFPYISDIFERNRGEVLEVGGVEDHVHVLAKVPRHVALSDLMKKIKVESTMLLRTQFSSCSSFEWQRGYGAFSVSKSGVEAVKSYIQTQEEHHRQCSSLEEWNRTFLNTSEKI